MRLVVLFGIVSLFADITYESMRSIFGPFFQVLGGSIVLVGISGGLGEIISYSIRPISGYIADRFKAHWFLTFLGYFVGLFSVPLMGFCYSPTCAFLLFQAERLGKSIRNPARDHIISSSTLKHGRAFAIHEAMDQIGAVLGPVIISFLISKGYNFALKMMIFPAFMSIAVLGLARKFYGKTEVSLEKKGDAQSGKFSTFIVFVFLTSLGVLNFQIISYHLKISGFSDQVIPLMFAGAMIVDSLSALIFGYVFDKNPVISLIFVPIFGFLGTLSVVNPFFIVFWGAYMGLYESVVRSGVAKLAKGAYAFGNLYFFSGIASFISGAIFGKLYEIGIEYMILLSFVLNLIAFVSLRKVQIK